MIGGPCALHIPLHNLPAHVSVVRGGQRVRNPAGGPSVSYLQRGDRITVAPPSVLKFSYAGNGYRIPHGHLRLQCRRVILETGKRSTVLAVVLASGRVQIVAGSRARQALVLTPEMLALA